MSFKLACYFPAENPLFLPINIDSDAWVEELSGAIGLELKSLGREVSRADLRLYKTDVPLEPEETLTLRALQWLRQHSINHPIKKTGRLCFVFPDGPHPISNLGRLDIIVANAEVLEMIKGLDDPYHVYNRKVKKALNECSSHLSPRLSPSDAISSSEKLAAVFAGDDIHIHLGRPGGAPAVIFNPVLAALQQRLDLLEQVEVSIVDVDRAARYLRSTVQFYKDENQRQNSVKELFDQAIGKGGEWQKSLNLDSGNIKPDGCWWHDNDDVFLMLVLELKNTLGLGGDALYQAVVDYSKIVSQDKYKRFREYCNFPIVLVGATANRLEISVAVCVGPIYVTKLLALDLFLDFHASNNMIRLARVFKTLSACRVDLKNYYDGVNSLVSPPRLSSPFPDPTPIDPSQPLPKLTFRKFLSRAGQPTSALVDLRNATTTIYIATLDDTNEDVIVKFTVRYNEPAHRLLADAQLAPRLHFCGRVVGDLFMIIMEHVNGMSVWQLQEDKMPIPPIIAEKVERAVRLLHDKDIVLGDLRGNNILYVASESRVVLIDLDWPGKNDEARYPATLNPAEIGKAWSERVVPYGTMQKADDTWQLDRLRALCRKSLT